MLYTKKQIKFVGIKGNDKRSPSDNEETLRHVLTKEMKIPRCDIDKIEFERVHRIPTKPNTRTKSSPSPIIAKVTFFQDKDSSRHISSFKRSKLGVADDFPKVRKVLHPVLKKARQEQKLAFFNVEKLIIDGKIGNVSRFTTDSWKAVSKANKAR